MIYLMGFLLIDCRLDKYGKLDKEELEFLKVLKIEIPEMVNEFPILFDELKKK